MKRGVIKECFNDARQGTHFADVRKRLLNAGSTFHSQCVFVLWGGGAAAQAVHAAGFYMKLSKIFNLYSINSGMS